VAATTAADGTVVVWCTSGSGRDPETAAGAPARMRSPRMTTPSGTHGEQRLALNDSGLGGDRAPVGAGELHGERVLEGGAGLGRLLCFPGEDHLVGRVR
jgi:hypothetical protein